MLLQNSLYAQQREKMSFRKYLHVKLFYAEIVDDILYISKKYKLPPAAILAIAGLESGYGSGYVAQITGNILSLGAFKGDKVLPPLYLPYSKSKKMILFDPKDINKLPKSDLEYKLRAKSYKRDYRPFPYAGTTKNLTLLKYNSALRKKAHQLCFRDFATRWIVKNSNIKVFRDTRIWLDEQIAKNSDEILFSMKLNKEFVNHIGGVKNSFNYRKSWPKKVQLIMDKAGLVALMKNMKYNKKTFDEAWREK
jgi:hypothetical protein